jgi:hypothetical protein
MTVRTRSSYFSAEAPGWGNPRTAIQSAEVPASVHRETGFGASPAQPPSTNARIVRRDFMQPKRR